VTSEEKTERERVYFPQGNKEQCSLFTTALWCQWLTKLSFYIPLNNKWVIHFGEVLLSKSLALVLTEETKRNTTKANNIRTK